MIDWDDLRLFLAIARHGTLSKAARALGVSQPTIGRRLDAFEARMGSKLFRRTSSGHTLTSAGRDILVHAEAMDRSAIAAQRVATGRDSGVTGPVRISTTKWFASAILAPILAPLGARHPGLVIDLVATASWSSLSEREVDMALRFTRFDREDIVQRAVAKLGFGLYASELYLAERGLPDFARGCPGHLLVTMNDEVTMASDVGYLAELAHAAEVSFRSNAREAQAAAAAAGAGIICLPDLLAAKTPRLVRLAPPTPPPDRVVWLGVHEDSRQLPRISAVSAAVVKGLEGLKLARPSASAK